MSQTKYIRTFEDIKRQLELEQAQREATKTTGTKVNLSTSNSRNGPKRKSQENWTDKDGSNEEPKHDQQGKEKCARKKDLMHTKRLNYDQMGYHARDCIEPKKVLSNIS